MKTLPLILIAAAATTLGVVIYLAMRRPAVSAEVRDLGKDAQRGARDAYNSTKDAAEDAKDAVKDAVR